MINTIVIKSLLKYEIVLFASYLTSFYIYKKSLRINLSKISITIVCIACLIISTLCAILRLFDSSYYRILFVTLTLLSFVLVKREKYFISIPSAIFSIGISYCIEIACVFIVAPLFYYLGYLEIDYFSELCGAFLQIIFTFFFTRIKRFKNGFTFTKDKSRFGINLLISGPIIILASIQKEHFSDSYMTIIAIGLIISSIGFFLSMLESLNRPL